MSQQTTEKLRRLLAMEVAKRKAAEALHVKMFQAYAAASGDAVLWQLRCQQAMQILTGEVDD